MRIAIIHEWLVTYAGSERALEQILAIYPDADLFCVVDFIDNQQRDFILGKPKGAESMGDVPISFSDISQKTKYLFRKT